MLFIERTSSFTGGGSQSFNHFLAELTARADLFAAAENCVAKKTMRTFRMPHGFDFATQNLGTRAEFPHLIRKPPALRKTVGFPKICGNFPQKPRPEARQTTEMRYNCLKLDLVVYRVGESAEPIKLSVGEKNVSRSKKSQHFLKKTLDR